MLRITMMGILLLFISGCATTGVTLVVESKPPHGRPEISIRFEPGQSHNKWK